MDRRNFLKLALAPGAVVPDDKSDEIRELVGMATATRRGDDGRKRAIENRLMEILG